MLKQLIRRLGLDRVEDRLSQEMQRMKIEVLQEERKVVQSLLDRIEERIASLNSGGKASAKKRAPGRPKGSSKAVVRTRGAGETLKDYVLKTMTEAGGPMQLAAIAENVRKLGYNTTAKPGTLLTSVHKVLRDSSLYKRIKRGVYRLKRQTGEPATSNTRKE